MRKSSLWFRGASYSGPTNTTVENKPLAWADWISARWNGLVDRIAPSGPAFRHARASVIVAIVFGFAMYADQTAEAFRVITAPYNSGGAVVAAIAGLHQAANDSGDR